MSEITSSSSNAHSKGTSLHEKPTLNSNDELTDNKHSTVKVAVNPTSSDNDKHSDSDDAIIVTGADAAAHLLPLRDDGDSALTFRGLLLASGLACFQAVMHQIYTVSTCPISFRAVQHDLITSTTVQTNVDHDSRDFHRSHLLLRWKSVGGHSSTR